MAVPSGPPIQAPSCARCCTHINGKPHRAYQAALAGAGGDSSPDAATSVNTLIICMAVGPNRAQFRIKAPMVSDVVRTQNTVSSPMASPCHVTWLRASLTMCVRLKYHSPGACTGGEVGKQGHRPPPNQRGHRTPLTPGLLEKVGRASSSSHGGGRETASPATGGTESTPPKAAKSLFLCLPLPQPASPQQPSLQAPGSQFRAALKHT